MADKFHISSPRHFTNISIKPPPTQELHITGKRCEGNLNWNFKHQANKWMCKQTDTYQTKESHCTFKFCTIFIGLHVWSWKFHGAMIQIISPHNFPEYPDKYSNQMEILKQHLQTL